MSVAAAGPAATSAKSEQAAATRAIRSAVNLSPSGL
jgi:hypothetical protein